MIRSSVIFVAAILACHFLVAQGNFTVQGKLLGADGKPMLMAHIQVQNNAPSFPRSILQSIQAKDDGSFLLPFSNPGFYRLLMSGVDHYSTELSVLLEGQKTVDLHVKLKQVEYKETFDSVLVIGDFNNFGWTRGAIRMVKQLNGTFTTTIQTANDTLTYQLIRVDKNGHSINGQKSDRFVYDGGGDYRSIVTGKNRSVLLTFDPTKAHTSTRDAEITFADPVSIPAKVYSAVLNIQARKDRASKAYQEFRAAGNDGSDFKYDWSNDLKEIAALEKRESSPTLHDFWLVARIVLSSPHPDSQAVDQALASIPPTSPLWSYDVVALGSILQHVSADVKQFHYLKRFIDTHPDAEIKAPMFAALFTALKSRDQDSLFASYFQKFVSEYSSSPWAKSTRSRFAPNRVVQLGNSVPHFKISALMDSGTVYSSSSMLGKIYLIDFWAVWCAPCVGEMKYLHEAYDKFHNKGLEILSISHDFKAEDVESFRKTKWPMPWLHAYDGSGATSELSKAFEISYIPKPILIGKDGKIIATEDSLRGEKLCQTLSKFFQ